MFSLLSTLAFSFYSCDDGGEFTSVFACSENTLADDGSTLTLKYIAQINGTWQVSVGDLVLKYSLGTLKVKIKDESLKQMALK